MPSQFHSISANLARIVFDPTDKHQQKFLFHGKKEYSRVEWTTRSHLPLDHDEGIVLGLGGWQERKRTIMLFFHEKDIKVDLTIIR
jgi:hypothetical protein